MRTAVFDIESDGLLDTITKLHCIAIWHIEEKQMHFFGPDKIEEGIRFLMTFDRVIAHNGLTYDAKAIEIVYPWFKCPPLWDTLIFCKMVWPADTLMGPDLARWKQGRLPGKLMKRQSIEAWGHRLGVHKVGADISDWSTYTDYMGERNRSDVMVNLALWELILKRIGWDPSGGEEFVWSRDCFDLEHDVAELMWQQEQIGFGFNKKAALKLASELTTTQHRLSRKLVDTFGSWWEPGETVTVSRTVNMKLTGHDDVTIPRFSEKTGKRIKDYVGPPLATYFQGAQHTPVTWTTFNPSSRQHLGNRLQAVYAWKPLTFGGANGDQAKVDEETIKDIAEQVLPADVKKAILEYFAVTKTLGQLSIGKQSWLSKCADDGAIHGQVDALGAVTARGTHKNPNLGQVPSVEVKDIKDDAGNKIGKEILKGLEGGFGWECRDLFIFRTGEGTGTDAAGLELRGLGHHLAEYDEGAFAKRVSDPTVDIHTENSKLTGLERAPTKTVSYAYVYGAGPHKLGSEVGYKESEKAALLASTGLVSYLRFMKQRLGKDWQEPTEIDKCLIAKGLEVKKKFEQGITGIKDLKKAIADRAESNGAGKFPWLEGLDGRKIFVRKAHAGLNTQLQSDGAIICKVWMVRFHKEMEELGYVHGVDFWQVAWVHDELQIEHRTGIGKDVAEASERAMKYAEKKLGYRCALATSAKTGGTWAETH